MKHLRIVALAFALGASSTYGCGGPLEDERDFHGEEPEPGIPESKADQVSGVVSDYLWNTCSTSVVLGLSRQIAAEIACMSPSSLSHFPQGDGIVFTGSAVLPYLSHEAIADLRAAARRAGTIYINSGFRTVAQQYLLYNWYLNGRCGIPAAARPGRSNHESGRAVDLANWSSAKRTMEANGWSHYGSNDPVHFDHFGSPDIRGRDVRAFQRLWNRNHPADQIAVDGVYGSQTGARIARAPAAGFPLGACASSTVSAAAPFQTDNGDTSRFRTSDGWTRSTSVTGYSGADYLVLAPGTSGWASWGIGPSATGSYEVFVHFTPHTNRNPRAIYRVRTSRDATPRTIEVDQRSGGKASLGTHTLTASAWLSVTGARASGYTIADLVSAVPR